MRNARFGLHFHVVEDRNPRCLTAGACRGRNGNQRLGRPWNRLPFANGRIDVVEKFSRVAGIQIGDFGRIYSRSTANGDKPIKGILLGKGNSLLERSVCRLDSHAVINGILDALPVHRS